MASIKALQSISEQAGMELPTIEQILEIVPKSDTKVIQVINFLCEGFDQGHRVASDIFTAMSFAIRHGSNKKPAFGKLRTLSNQTLELIKGQLVERVSMLRHDIASDREDQDFSVAEYNLQERELLDCSYRAISELNSDKDDLLKLELEALDMFAIEINYRGSLSRRQWKDPLNKFANKYNSGKWWSELFKG